MPRFALACELGLDFISRGEPDGANRALLTEMLAKVAPIGWDGKF